MGEDAGLLVARLRDFERPPRAFRSKRFNLERTARRAAAFLFYLTPPDLRIARILTPGPPLILIIRTVGQIHRNRNRETKRLMDLSVP